MAAPQADDRRRHVIQKVLASANLPAVPDVAIKILSLCNDPEVDFQELATHIAADAAMVAKLLKIANSAVYGGRGDVTSVQTALTRLGLKVTRMTVLGFALETDLSDRAPSGMDIDAFWRAALTTGIGARLLAGKVNRRRQDDAFANGLLQDIGIMGFHCAMPEEYAKVLAECEANPTAERHVIEERLLGTTHMEVGGVLLKTWGIPADMWEPVLYHQDPEVADNTDLSDSSAEMARILCFGAAVGTYFHGRAKGIVRATLLDMAERRFGLDEAATYDILENIEQGVRDTCDLFKLDPESTPSYALVAAQAAREVSRLAQEIGQESQAAQMRAQRDAAELQQLKQETAELKKLAAYDELTALLNRREFAKRFEIELSRSKRYKQPLGVLLCDIDHFKSVNDTYGHPAGDHVLKMLGKYLTQTVRLPDVVCRYGGEEFVVLLPQTGEHGVVIAAERFRLGIEQASREWVTEFEGRENITVSVGLAHAEHTSPHFNAEDMLERADQCLYAAKGAGRNCTRYATI